MTAGETPIAEMRATLDATFDVVLSPVASAQRPALDAIRIVDSLFAIGRSDPPFSDYSAERIARLSRRHARIFTEHGAVYVADLGSKNGTTLNGVAVRQAPARVRAGDELCFGGELCYRVGIEPRARIVAAATAAPVPSLLLVPQRDDLGLLPIDVQAFPFLISKTDEVFARYKDRYPHQVNYISRRHAHVFLKSGELYLEDLGSTNGTFVGGKRLDEVAVPLAEGDVLAFGGDHFVYRVTLKQPSDVEPTVTQLSLNAAAGEAADADKTTFVGAAHSFLDIFCVDPGLQREDEVNEQAHAAATHAKRDTHTGGENGASGTGGTGGTNGKQGSNGSHGPHAAKGRPQRWRLLAGELRNAFAGGERTIERRAVWGSCAAFAVLLAVALTLYMRGSSERDLRNLLASGDYSSAVTVANDYLAHHPDDTKIGALASEALLKAKLPGWLNALQKAQFDQADALLKDMRSLSTNNADAASLVGELQWVGDLERFVTGRGGVEAPIRMYADESTIKGLLQRWEDDAKGHQRALDRIASYVPVFAEPYAQALSHLRKLESDDSVYIAAIDRLNGTIRTELARDKPDALPAVLDDYAQRYPRLAGLDRVREDLRLYTEVLNAVLSRQLTSLLTLLRTVRFSTPPFQAQFQQLAASRLPSPDIIQRHDAASAAWQRGDTQQALSDLQAMPAGPWSDVIAAERAHKKALLDQFADLQKIRGSKDYEQRLLSFYASLDPTADAWFVQSIQKDVAALHDKALARAQDLLLRAQSLWKQYRANGPIGGTQRLEAGISPGFRSAARLLSDAQAAAQQGMRIYTQLKADHPADFDRLLADIDAEADLQRRSLTELRMVLDPGLLKAKLALIGGEQSETRQSP
ncbi:FHA domain-containing protein [Paraburkholderia fungorum]|jgi:pSer/pThr/pTyr-binding forkhead associated (FHA) protein|uniref:FHA domain-containing protein n=1 Tax=Paraburkholderia fungorum TaxID=134537 RepID=A0AAP5V0E0_9BURK|nr:FHA domain-containing protein [Paraburkholderia fungorum]MDT8843224.1 FHA domain-containing protein [Paraburkholderia fungorum]PRZ51689.1 pSer/pThr/pTyr-binding forkhead associated (FHA) protein [Paraburkholderia fungorum]